MNTSNESANYTTINASSVNWSNNQINSFSSSLRVQINDYDTYQTLPTRLDQLCTQVTQVPIIRIYGSLSVQPSSDNTDSPNKKKRKINETTSPAVFHVVIHVHNFYPDIYVDCNETDLTKLENEKFINLVTDYLEAALKESFKNRKSSKNFEDDESNNLENSKPSGLRKYIANVSVCKGVPIYGFQLGYRMFYKISLLSPLYKSRLAKLFQENTISLFRIGMEEKENVIYNPEPTYVYEAHIPYLLQFLTDYNLFGCGWINIDKDFVSKEDAKTRGLYFRSPILRDIHKSCHSPNHLHTLLQFLSNYITTDNVLYNGQLDSGNPCPFNRIGKSILEIDITTNSILNRDWLSPRELHDDFVEKSEYLEYKRAIESGGHKYGYKYDNEGQPRIYLSSLKQIYNDLKYQCRSRDSSFDVAADVLETGHSSYFGTGSTNWSNQDQLKELFDYFKKLNGEVKLDSPNYSKKYIQSRKLKHPIVFARMPTAFQLVDIEKTMIHHKLKMRVGSDLLNWTNYLLLFESQHDQKLDNDIPIAINILPEENLSENESSDNNDMAMVNANVNSNADENLITETPFDGEPTENAQENNNEESDECKLTQLHQFDETLMRNLTQIEATQTANFLGVEDLSYLDDFSFTPSQNQPGFKNLNMTDCSYEVPISDQLKPENVNRTFQMAGLLKVNYSDPFYDNLNDVPTKPLVFANQKIVVPMKNESSIPSLEMSQLIKQTTHITKPISQIFSTWQYVPDPPSKLDVSKWLKHDESHALKKNTKYQFQIEPGVTQSHDYKYSYDSMKVSRRPDEFNCLTSFHMELHANPPNCKLAVDPLRDPISLIFYSFDDSNDMFGHLGFTSGILIFDNTGIDLNVVERLSLTLNKHIEVFDDELKMITKLVTLVELFDPDILSGYEVNSMSWGYIVERLRDVFGMNIMLDLSRGSFKSNGKFGDRWGYTHTSNIKISGRHMLNVWRPLRSEMSLTSYSLENVAYHLLHKSLPRYSNYTLSEWLKEGNFSSLLTVLSYYINRVDIILKIINVQELITRNVEHSRLIGIEFNSNFYRGSQYKVESILARICKPESLLLNSPSKQQVHEMRPIECIPLILEPKSNFYKSPLVVLDFQSLYPSIMIAYNYCYSTLVGKLHNYRPTKNNIGYLHNLKIPFGLVNLLEKEDGFNISPNGFVFVKSHIRKSILAKMLEEILSIRIKIKQVMKLFKEDAELTKLYNSKQLALKLIANVTYGYTSATFSGRMPNSDIADAIVSTGREILNKSIELIDSGNYGAKVVYGDTDSLFVYFPGKPKTEAFKLGKQIAKTITDYFPDPVKLKFEKVYHPCVLLAKKRYVGFSYEYEDQTTPKFDAKGIETVRRDGIPAQSKMTEKTLRILFETKNLSKVKQYTIDQFYKIIFNKVPIRDFCFAKEVRYGTYKNEKYLPPGAIIAKNMAEEDPRKEPQYRERVPYVVIRDSSKPRIKDRCISPEDFIRSYETNSPASLDYTYYITRVLIPPLERIFNLIGVDVNSWYREMPVVMRGSHVAYAEGCLVCGNRLDDSANICSNCRTNEQEVIADVISTSRDTEEKLAEVESVCRDCVKGNTSSSVGSFIDQCTDNCVNGDCMVYYNKFKLNNESKQIFSKKDKILRELDW
ncbi:DNA polymerase zeta catalytic subunit, putative [Candida dubliniensis CD36]|uniref:DNA polymerase n=1 Tax=Candida dubliniensis (strain CD36 / ATCC MYA-646 / CBS 7987 / NCPF 3949 / NRRL Y-17841) TaxID=573826 RepID=B9WEI8_CANDC|nr:DNA polymerase zeta catalytic subunit, putative [Candida dubliniensis CD36]CAX43100.1 DNA polymerase zeta catalytic subunit, putative [Candida dubliniensis CD36]